VLIPILYFSYLNRKAAAPVRP
ncbi:MAG: hypothetical protein QG601_1630, partial [Pseudomonadota bacterium]|nr:hypothetical protein [Pseudomonadota bacterium]